MIRRIFILLISSMALSSCAQSPADKNIHLNTENKKGMTTDLKTDTITFGAGCFWCVEAIFQQLDGVISVSSGYSGGHVKNPSYKEVCNGTTGHAEVCRIVYDPKKL